jgi:hypothetical protein
VIFLDRLPYSFPKQVMAKAISLLSEDTNVGLEATRPHAEATALALCRSLGDHGAPLQSVIACFCAFAQEMPSTCKSGGEKGRVIARG